MSEADQGGRQWGAWLLHDIRSYVEGRVASMVSDALGGCARSGCRVMGRHTGCPPSHLSLCVAPGLLLIRAFCFWCLVCEGTSGVERGSGL
eukprot:1529965-Prymnesium_polylepis.1